MTDKIYLCRHFVVFEKEDDYKLCLECIGRSSGDRICYVDDMICCVNLYIKQI